MRGRVLAAAVLLAPLPAAADGTPYIGLGLLNWTYDVDGIDEASSNAFQFTLGRQLNQYVSLEGRFATGGSDTVPVFVPNFGTVDAEVELDQAFSLMFKPHTGGEDARAYGLFGFSQGELTASSNGFSVTEDDSGVSYGAGFEVALGDTAWLNVEYVNYLRDDDYTFDAVTVGTRLEF